MGTNFRGFNEMGFFASTNFPDFFKNHEYGEN